MKKQPSDYLYATIKGLASLVPIAGGPLSVLFESVFSAPLDKRKMEWLYSLDEALKELTKKVGGLTPEHLSKNEVFISVAMQATQIALRNHQKEKLNALKNAVINSVQAKEIDENKMLMFIRIIDEITPLHIQILSFLDNPNKYEKILQEKAGPNTTINFPGNYNVWSETYPELDKQEILVEQIVKELYSKGFLVRDNMRMGSEKLTTNYGKEFLEFIEN